MRLTASLIDKLISLSQGLAVPSSQLRGEWVEDLLRDGVLISTSNASRKSYRILDRESFLSAMERIHEGLGNLERMRSILLADHGGTIASRAEQASETGNSKLLRARSFPGFLVSSYEAVPCVLNGRELTLDSLEGASCFVFDWHEFRVPENVTVMGIENPENFRHIHRQRALFESLFPGTRLLFVSRYPQSRDLRLWLQSVRNRYVHFGDFDLAGIRIFLAEFHRYLPGRSSFLIPSDIEERIRRFGSRNRFNGQYEGNRNLHSDIPELQHLIDLILRYHRCYDQEGYIRSFQD